MWGSSGLPHAVLSRRPRVALHNLTFLRDERIAGDEVYLVTYHSDAPAARRMARRSGITSRRVYLARWAEEGQSPRFFGSYDPRWCVSGGGADLARCRGCSMPRGRSSASPRWRSAIAAPRGSNHPCRSPGVETYPVRIPLKPARRMISAWGSTVSDCVLVRVLTDSGLEGAGEATVIPRWSGETA